MECLIKFVELINLLPESSKWKEYFKKYLEERDLLQKERKK